MTDEQTIHDEHPSLASANRPQKLDDDMASGGPRSSSDERSEQDPEGSEDATDHPPMPPWKDRCPSSVYFKRALHSEQAKRAKYKAAGKAAVAEIDQLKAQHAQELAEAYELVRTAARNYASLENKFREIYVELQFLKSRDDDAADGQPAGVAPD